MYIGTRERGVWVPAPKISNYENSAVGWQTRQDFLNGGVRVRRSIASHRKYSFTWDYISRENARKITDLYGGLSGTGPIYFLDPFAIDQNLAPAHWAAPMQGAYDAPLLIKGAKPTLSDTSAVNNLGYPLKTATYPSSSGEKRKLFVPLPDGFTLWAGVHGPVTGGTVTAAPVLTGNSVGTAVGLTALGTDSTTRVNTSWAQSSGYSGVEFSVQDAVSYTGLIIQVLPTGATPATGGFISGQGHSGSDFTSTPHQEPYSAARDYVGVTVELEETNDWL
jgi:hypothetical protein